MTPRPSPSWVVSVAVVVSVLATFAVVLATMALPSRAIDGGPTTTTTPGVVLIPPASVTRGAGA